MRTNYCLSWEHICSELSLLGYKKKSAVSFCLCDLFSGLFVVWITFWLNSYSVKKSVFFLVYLCREVFWVGRRFCLNVSSQSSSLRISLSSHELCRNSVLVGHHKHYEQLGRQEMTIDTPGMQRSIVPWTFTYKTQFKDKIIKKFKSARTEHQTKLRGLSKCGACVSAEVVCPWSIGVAVMDPWLIITSLQQILSNH